VLDSPDTAGKATNRFTDLAANRELRAVCWDGLSRSHHCFATPLPQALIAILQSPPSRLHTEASAYFLVPRPHPWQVLCADLCALPGVLNRLRLIQEYAFPPATYMVARYAALRRYSLPFLYAYRLLRGLLRFFQAVP
jgi:hypothetical protein